MKAVWREQNETCGGFLYDISFFVAKIRDLAFLHKSEIEFCHIKIRMIACGDLDGDVLFVLIMHIFEKFGGVSEFHKFISPFFYRFVYNDIKGEIQNKYEEDKIMGIEKINEDDLGNVSGGRIFNAAGIIGADQNKPWEVIDDVTGNNIYENGQKVCFDNKKDAEDYAKKHNMNWSEIFWDELSDMRSKHN